MKDSITSVWGGGSVSKCDKVTQIMLSRIINGAYRTGDRLPTENSLAEEFGVSRATIREAFKKLNMLSVVTIRQGDGMFVSKVDGGQTFAPLFSSLLFEHTSIEQLYDVRMWLEMAAVSMACGKTTQKNSEEILVLIREMDKAMANADPIRYADLDDRFHLHLFEMADNLALLSIFTTMRDIVKLYRVSTLSTVPHMRISNDRHRRILEALEAGDELAAVGLIRRHVEISKQQLLENMRGAMGASPGDGAEQPGTKQTAPARDEGEPAVCVVPRPAGNRRKG